MALSNTVRNMMLVLLTMTSGCVDAISFLALGQVFTAAMTGNTVLFGLAVTKSGGLHVAGYAVALLGFVLGAAVGAVILRRIQKTTGWGRLVTTSIVVELLALILFVVVISVAHQPLTTGAVANLLILILAFAMGVQGVTARRIGVNGVTTTVITSTLTGLVESLVWKVRIPSRAAKQSGVVSTQANSLSFESVGMWISVIVVYGIGAGVCGEIQRYWSLQAIWLPIGIVFVVIVTAITSSRCTSMASKPEMSA